MGNEKAFSWLQVVMYEYILLLFLRIFLNKAHLGCECVYRLCEKYIGLVEELLGTLKCFPGHPNIYLIGELVSLATPQNFWKVKTRCFLSSNVAT